MPMQLALPPASALVAGTPKARATTPVTAEAATAQKYPLRLTPHPLNEIDLGHEAAGPAPSIELLMQRFKGREGPPRAGGQRPGAGASVGSGSWGGTYLGLSSCEDAAIDERRRSLVSRLEGVWLVQLVHLYAEKESPKFEKAAMRWLGRYLAERSLTLQNFAQVVRSLERRQLDT
jgi:hypothetical protein